MILEGKRIWVAGKGMVGKSIIRKLENFDLEIFSESKENLDLRDPESTKKYLKEIKPDIIFLSAAKVGGILANESYPVDFLYDNIAISSNVINQAHLADINNLVFLGSTCIYPRDSSQPIKEEYLLSGPLEKTNQWYAIAKIAGIKLVEAYRRQYKRKYISVLPTNLYGYHDTFDTKNGHVIPSLMAKIHTAKINKEKSFSVWGSGIAKREFLFVDDLADGIIFLAQNYDSDEIINIGSNEEISIRDLCFLLKKVINFEGDFEFDITKPDGTLRKKTDLSKINSLGWKSSTSLKKGLIKTYEWYVDNL